MGTTPRRSSAWSSCFRFPRAVRQRRRRRYRVLSTVRAQRERRTYVTRNLRCTRRLTTSSTSMQELYRPQRRATRAISPDDLEQMRKWQPRAASTTAYATKTRPADSGPTARRATYRRSEPDHDRSPPVPKHRRITAGARARSSTLLTEWPPDLDVHPKLQRRFLHATCDVINGGTSTGRWPRRWHSGHSSSKVSRASERAGPRPRHFSQRHAVSVRPTNERKYIPLAALADDQATVHGVRHRARQRVRRHWVSSSDLQSADPDHSGPAGKRSSATSQRRPDHH